MIKWLKKRLRNEPRLFSKAVVVWCVLFGSACCAYALRILSRTDNDPTGVLGVILAFLGGELALLFGRDALKKRKDEDQ